jgi:hypothetical protein
MTTDKLIDRIKGLLKQPPEKTKLKKLRKTVKALKEKQQHLEKKLADTEGKHERQRIEQKIKVLRKQRSKGCELYRVLKDA